MELNKVFLLGNLTRDPELRHTNSGTPVCQMGLAVNSRRGGRNTETREETLFIDVDAWSRTAELCAEYLRKGSQVLIEGRLKLDSYQTQAGEKRNKIHVVADRVQFGPRSGGSSGSGSYGNRDNYSSSRRDDSAREEAGFQQDDGGTDDDLPF